MKRLNDFSSFVCSIAVQQFSKYFLHNYKFIACLLILLKFIYNFYYIQFFIFSSSLYFFIHIFTFRLMYLYNEDMFDMFVFFFHCFNLISSFIHFRSGFFSFIGRYFVRLSWYFRSIHLGLAKKRGDEKVHNEISKRPLHTKICLIKCL